MLYCTDIGNYVPERNTIITAGKFDGVHRGHQKLLKRAEEIAKETDCATCVFTFGRSPQAALSHKRSVMILENAERRSVIEQLGADLLFECRFTESIRNMEPVEFVEKILIGQLSCIGIVVGTDFRFGKNRAGDPAFLEEYGRNHGLRVEVIEKLMDQDREISSTYVREELVKGRMEKVNELLGYLWFCEGTIEHGAHNGHLIGFPTVNIVPGHGKLLPPPGVYQTVITIDGITRRSITNIGVRPTFNGTHTTVETNIPGFEGDLYGKKAKVEFLRFVRPEKKFESIDALKKQIESDVRSLGF